MNTLKAISETESELRVGNYIVLFGGKDLSGEFFTKNTNFESNYTDLGVLYEDFEHGRDYEKAGNSAHNVLGIVDWKTAKADETGIFVERVLNRRADYVKYLAKLIDSGLVGTSSEAVSGKVSKRSNGEIVDWPLMRDSLTVTPMEPRMVTSNVLEAAKSLAEVFPSSKSLAMLAGNPIDEKPETLKSIELIEDLKGAEAYLRDSAGMTRSQALAFIARVKSLGQRDADEGKEQEIVAALKAREVYLPH